MKKFSKEEKSLIKADIKEIKNEIKSIKKAVTDEVYKETCKNKYQEIEDRFSKEQVFKKFQLIYIKYGKEAYGKYVPRKYKEDTLTYLYKNNCFLNIYEQFGELEIKEHLDEIMAEDIKQETGSKIKATLSRVKYIFLKKFAPSAMAVTLAFPALITTYAEKNINEENKEHAQKIAEYIDDIKEYGEEVRSYNLTDLQNIMIVMDDMWTRIKGYGKPELDLLGYAGIDVSKEGGIGVCRNMADDFVRRINEINPEYNARKITVYTTEGEYKPADIDVRIARTEENVILNFDAEGNPIENPEKDTEEKTEQNEVPIEENESKIEITIDTKKIFGNHVVVIMTIPEDNIELIVDPTNAGIGIYKNGQITLFNSGKENPLTLKVKELGAMMYGVESVAQVPLNIVKSISIKDTEKYSKKYGIESQNEALQTVRKMRSNEFFNRIRYNEKSNTTTITEPKTQEKKNTYELENER